MPTTSEHAIETKLIAARTRLIMDRPFLGALVLRLPLQAADSAWCPRALNDARTLFYNPAYVELLSFEQVQFVLGAEALHCALLHFERRAARDPHRWAEACAHAVNHILVEDGLRPPPDALLNSDFLGLTAEEIYGLLDAAGTGDSCAEAEPSQAPAGGPGHDARKKPPAPPGPDHSRQLGQLWRRRLAGAAHQARRAGKLGGSMARAVQQVLRPTLPWRAVLARYMNSMARDDFSYARPTSRRGDPAILPSLRSSELRLVVALDVSGSIDADELNDFVAEVDALKAQVRAQVTVLTCDSKVTGDSPWTFEAWERCALPGEVMGSGATDFRPVFEWTAAQDQPPDVLIYFTDAAGRFPDLHPHYEVIWLVKGIREVPWGQRIQLT